MLVALLCSECWLRREPHDSVCYGSSCTWEKISRLLWVKFSRGQKDHLKAIGLLTLISYLIPALAQVYSPANRSDIRISSFVQAEGFGAPQGFGLCVSAWLRSADVSIIWLAFPLAPEQPVRMRNRRKRGEGNTYLHSGADRCSMRVIASCSKGKRRDW